MLSARRTPSPGFRGLKSGAPELCILFPLPVGEGRVRVSALSSAICPLPSAVFPLAPHAMPIARSQTGDPHPPVAGAPGVLSQREREDGAPAPLWTPRHLRPAPGMGLCKVSPELNSAIGPRRDHTRQEGKEKDLTPAAFTGAAEGMRKSGLVRPQSKASAWGRRPRAARCASPCVSLWTAAARRRFSSAPSRNQICLSSSLPELRECPAPQPYPTKRKDLTPLLPTLANTDEHRSDEHVGWMRK
jgi:hypothetical protein